MLNNGYKQQKIYSVFLYCLKHKLSRTYKCKLWIWEYWFPLYCLQVSLLIIHTWISSAIRNRRIQSISFVAYIHSYAYGPSCINYYCYKAAKRLFYALSNPLVVNNWQPGVNKVWTTLWVVTSTYWDIFLHYVNAIGVGPLGCT